MGEANTAEGASLLVCPLRERARGLLVVVVVVPGGPWWSLVEVQSIRISSVPAPLVSSQPTLIIALLFAIVPPLVPVHYYCDTIQYSTCALHMYRSFVSFHYSHVFISFSIYILGEGEDRTSRQCTPTIVASCGRTQPLNTESKKTTRTWKKNTDSKRATSATPIRIPMAHPTSGPPKTATQSSFPNPPTTPTTLSTGAPA